MRCLLLCDQLSSIEFHQHRAICLKFFHGYRKSKVIKDEELKFEVVEFHEGKTANLEIVSTFGNHQTLPKGNQVYLCVSRICVEDIGEEFASTSYASNDKSVNVVTVHHEKLR